MRRAKHNLSHYRVTAGDFGKLYPFSATEVLPGDTFRASSSALVRIQPLMTPLMHPVDISIAHFFVPTRLVFDGFEDFMTGKNENGMPTIATTTAGDINDYMGVPPSNRYVNAIPTRAYNLIYNEFFRDQDLAAIRSEDTTSVANVAWKKDYFTTARPYPQQGSEGVAASIRFAEDVKVAGIGALANSPYVATGADSPIRDSWGQAQNGTWWTGDQASPHYLEGANGTATDIPNVRIPAGSVGGTLDINEWRKAMALQKFREHRSKFGSRYKDMLAFLGVNSPDARLDRPEYLGGGQQTLSFSEVLQTTETEAVPLGTQGGHGIASIRTRPYRKMFVEHGWTISLIHIRPKSMYLNATDRAFIRRFRGEFWQKEDEILGEQPVANRELFQTGPEDTTFGYSPRHDEYRTQRSYATGPMRDDAYATWHMARKFEAQPALNEDFIRCEPTKRVFRSQQDPQFYAMVQNRIASRRLVSKHARN